MTVTKGLATVAVSAVGFGVTGAAIGNLIGRTAPDFYRLVFGVGDVPNFNARRFGTALGLGQGLIAGVVAGLVVAVLVTWYEVYKLSHNDTPVSPPEE